MQIPCFWIEPAAFGQLWLRRFSWPPRAHQGEQSWSCEIGYHNATAQAEERIDVRRSSEGIIQPVLVGHDDPRWPTTCASCGYAFSETDQWQPDVREAWHRPDSGTIIAYGLAEVPAGAMWDAFWWTWRRVHTYPDGINLFVQLPDGMPWNVDGPSARNDQAGWTRTGDPKAIPPTVSAQPSILSPKYHGWLRDGFLVDA